MNPALLSPHIADCLVRKGCYVRLIITQLEQVVTQ
jgi:hypothetical protein